MNISMGIGKMAIIVAIVMMLSAIFVPAGTADKLTVTSPHVASIYGMNIGYHYLTANEAKVLEKTVGVKNPEKNYNQIVDGHGTGLAPPSAQDWKNMVGHLRVVNTVNAPQATRGSVDLTKEKYFPPIGNQGQQGSCASWAVDYYVHTYMEAKEHDWNASSGNLSYLMSPAWAYNRIDSGVDQGSTFYDNAMVLKTWGSATMATMPYSASNHVDWGTQRAMREAPLYKIQNFYFIPETSVVTKIKELLNQGIPVAFGINAKIPFYNDPSSYNYIITSNQYSTDLQPDHGETIVGYDDSISANGDIGAFKVANSWGAGWGDNGFYWVTYKAFKEVDYNNQAFPMYMTDKINYHPKLLAVWEYNNSPETDVNINFTVNNGSGVSWNKVFYNKELPGLHVKMPSFMAYDITNFSDAYNAGHTNITIHISNNTVSGAKLYEFYIERYSSTYVPGRPNELSPDAGGLPTNLSCNATVDFKPYGPISFDSAIDSNVLEFFNATYSAVNWVAVPYQHHTGNSALRSGVLGESGKSILAAKMVNGPGLLTFYWKISSQSGDSLTFYEGSKSMASISGEVNWTKVSVLVGAGVRELYWVYEKNDMGNAGNDTAWVDSVSWEHRNDKVPTAPSHLNATYGTGFVKISWGPSTADSGAPLQDYVIFRGINTTNLSEVATVDANTTFYNDTSVTNGILYYYVVKAENYVGLSNGSNAVKAQPVVFPENPTNLKAKNVYGGVNLTWTAPANVKSAGLSNYTIYRAKNGTDNYVIAGVFNVTSKTNETRLWLNDTTAQKGVKYDYYVVAVNWMGESKKSNIVSGMAYGTPDAPQNLKEIDGSGVVTLSWNKPLNNGGAPVTGYVIYRKAPGKDFVKVGEVNGNTEKYEDHSVTNNEEYIYVVVAVNKFGEGNRSAEVQANPADIVMNIGGNTIHMQFAELGAYVGIIVAIIIALLYLAKRRKSKKNPKTGGESKMNMQENEDTADSKVDDENRENNEVSNMERNTETDTEPPAGNSEENKPE